MTPDEMKDRIEKLEKENKALKERFDSLDQSMANTVAAWNRRMNFLKDEPAVKDLITRVKALETKPSSQSAPPLNG